MPLKVSSQGWVKVQPPPKPARKPRPDPEEKKESFCSHLRYFACQATDQSRERLRMLGERGEFSSSQVDLLRPHSRLERSSTLDEWRHDVQPSRSSSRQSGLMDGLNNKERSGTPSDNSAQRRNSDNDGRRHGEKGSRNHDAEFDSGASRARRNRVASAPVIISVTPSPSVCEENLTEELVEVEEIPDNVSVARTETPSERHCRRHHRHQKSPNLPQPIPEEEELEHKSAATSAKSEILRLWHDNPENDAAVSISAPPPSIIGFGTSRLQTKQLDSTNAVPTSASTSTTVPQTFLEPIPEKSAVHDERSIPTPLTKTITEPAFASAGSVKSLRSERSWRPERPFRSDRSDTSSRSSRSSRSESSYTSSQAETEDDSASSYSASTRSTSPIRQRKYDMKKYRHSEHERSRHDDDDISSSYPSPPASPPPPISRHRRNDPDPRSTSHEGPPVKAYRDRVATAPVMSTSRTSPASWSSGSSLSSSSGSSRSSAPSMDGYQFQAAIFQPKSNNYRGYRAPSLSKGNRWETATSALSFD